MSLRKMLRNIRKKAGYKIGLANAEPQGISFDLTTEEGRLAAKEWQDSHPLDPSPFDSDDMRS